MPYRTPASRPTCECFVDKRGERRIARSCPQHVDQLPPTIVIEKVGKNGVIVRHPSGHCFLSVSERDVKANEEAGRRQVEYLARVAERGRQLRARRATTSDS